MGGARFFKSRRLPRLNLSQFPLWDLPMPVTIAEYFRPENLREALEILQSPGPPAMVLAGGVSFTLSGSPRPVRAVDLQNADLQTIRSSASGLEIGAMTTLADLIESPEAAGILGGLIPRHAASPRARRCATLSRLAGISPNAIIGPRCRRFSSRRGRRYASRARAEKKR